MNTEFSLNQEQQNRILEAIHDLVNEADDNAEEHGFHEAYKALLEAVPEEQRKAARRTTILAKLGLIASEVGEAVSAVQHGDDDLLLEELADVMIRIFDLCGSECMELGHMLLHKMQKNRNRPYLHGKKC